ncbi:MAG: DsbA family oxidoreductase [Alphaproteobacteria bacterium]|nr:DsbA family oxidoreductase [Alphaproteobacteria bacterium]
MELDVVIDVVCPWCFVGKRQLDQALEARPGIVSIVRYRPYQLAPDTPTEGVDRKAYYEKKFGNSPQLAAMREHLLAQAPDLGIKFDFESDCTIGNSLDAHRLIRWALSPGKQAEVADGIMKAYFEDCAFIGDHALLVEIAGSAGMDLGLVADLLAGDTDKDLVRAEVGQAHQSGIRGVPMYIFDGKYAVSGAQGAEALIGVMDQIAAAT